MYGANHRVRSSSLRKNFPPFNKADYLLWCRSRGIYILDKTPNGQSELWGEVLRHNLNLAYSSSVSKRDKRCKRWRISIKIFLLEYLLKYLLWSISLEASPFKHPHRSWSTRSNRIDDHKLLVLIKRRSKLGKMTLQLIGESGKLAFQFCAELHSEEAEDPLIEASRW